MCIHTHTHSSVGKWKEFQLIIVCALCMFSLHTRNACRCEKNGMEFTQLAAIANAVGIVARRMLLVKHCKHIIIAVLVLHMMTRYALLHI